MNKKIILISVIVLLIALIRFSSFAFSEETSSPLTWKYGNAKVVPGYTADHVVQGIPVGQFITTKDPEPLNQTDPDAMMDVTNQRLDTENKFFSKDTKVLYLKNAKKHSSDSDISVSNPQVSEVEKPVFDEGKFRSCVAKALPLLKAKLRAESAGNTTAAGIFEKQLKKNRGNGLQVGIGLPCGKFLGKSGVGVPMTSAEVKILSAFEAREDKNEFQQLLKATVAAFHIDAPKASASLFQYYWMTLSLRAVFTKTALPKFDDIKKVVADTKHQANLSEAGNNYSVEFVLPYDLKELDQKTSLGLQFAEGIIGT